MKKTKRNYTVIALIVLLLILGIGYAVFSQNLIITGTAEADGTFSVYFSDAEIDRGSIVIGDSDANNTDNKVTIGGVLLAYPGDVVTGSVTIQNDSSVDVKLKTVTVTTSEAGNALATDHIVIAGLDVATGSVISAGTTGNDVEIPFTITWPEEADTDVDVAEELTFTITYEYEQNV